MWDFFSSFLVLLTGGESKHPDIIINYVCKIVNSNMYVVYVYVNVYLYIFTRVLYMRRFLIKPSRSINNLNPCNFLTVI